MEWEVTRYMIRCKMYVMIGAEKSGREIITAKLGEAMTLAFSGGESSSAHLGETGASSRENS